MREIYFFVDVDEVLAVSVRIYQLQNSCEFLAISIHAKHTRFTTVDFQTIEFIFPARPLGRAWRIKATKICPQLSRSSLGDCRFSEGAG